MSTPIAANAPATAKSNTDQVERIHSIDADIDRLKLSLQRWNKWYMFFTGATVVAALGIFLTQRAGLNKSVAISNLEREVSELRIAEVRAGAKAESDRVEQAGKESVSKAENVAKERIAKVESEANVKISAANERTAQLAKDTEGLKAQNLQTEAELEAERLTRLDMEKSLVPRVVITFVDPRTKKSTADPLKNFAIKVKLRYLPDIEAERAAASLADTLYTNGWKIVDKEPDREANSPFFDGILINTYFFGIRPSSTPSQGSDEQLRILGERQAIAKQEAWSREAAETLIKFLVDQGISARQMVSAPKQLQPDELIITVGFKPSPYFLPQAIKDVQKALEERTKRDFERYQKERQDSLNPKRP